MEDNGDQALAVLKGILDEVIIFKRGAVCRYSVFGGKGSTRDSTKVDSEILEDLLASSISVPGRSLNALLMFAMATLLRVRRRQ
jgi:hypothetical protein